MKKTITVKCSNIQITEQSSVVSFTKVTKDKTTSNPPAMPITFAIQFDRPQDAAEFVMSREYSISITESK